MRIHRHGTTITGLILSVMFMAATPAHAGAIPADEGKDRTFLTPTQDDPGLEQASPGVSIPDAHPIQQELQRYQLQWREEDPQFSNVTKSLDAQQIFGSEIARQLDQQGRQTVDDALSLEDLLPSYYGSPESGGVSQNGRSSRRSGLYDLAEDLLDPIHEGNGVISFSIAGLGRFLLMKDSESGKLLIMEEQTQFRAAISQDVLKGVDSESPSPSANGTLDVADEDMTFRQLIRKLLDLLIGGPQVLILSMVIGAWVTFKVWMRVRTRVRP